MNSLPSGEIGRHTVKLDLRSTPVCPPHLDGAPRWNAFASIEDLPDGLFRRDSSSEARRGCGIVAAGRQLVVREKKVTISGAKLAQRVIDFIDRLNIDAYQDFRLFAPHGREPRYAVGGVRQTITRTVSLFRPRCMIPAPPRPGLTRFDGGNTTRPRCVVSKIRTGDATRSPRTRIAGRSGLALHSSGSLSHASGSEPKFSLSKRDYECLLSGILCELSGIVELHHTRVIRGITSTQWKYADE